AIRPGAAVDMDVAGALVAGGVTLKGVTAGVISPNGKSSTSARATSILAAGGCAPGASSLSAMAAGVSVRSRSLTRFEVTRAPVCGPAFGLTVATAPGLASLADGAAAGAASGDCSAAPVAGDCV